MGDVSGSAPAMQAVKRSWPVRREHVSKYGRTDGKQMDVLAAHQFFVELDFNKWLTMTSAERGSRRDLKKLRNND